MGCTTGGDAGRRPRRRQTSCSSWARFLTCQLAACSRHLELRFEDEVISLSSPPPRRHRGGAPSRHPVVAALRHEQSRRGTARRETTTGAAGCGSARASVGPGGGHHRAHDDRGPRSPIAESVSPRNGRRTGPRPARPSAAATPSWKRGGRAPSSAGRTPQVENSAKNTMMPRTSRTAATSSIGSMPERKKGTARRPRRSACRPRSQRVSSTSACLPNTSAPASATDDLKPEARPAPRRDCRSGCTEGTAAGYSHLKGMMARGWRGAPPPSSRGANTTGSATRNPRWWRW